MAGDAGFNGCGSSESNDATSEASGFISKERSKRSPSDATHVNDAPILRIYRYFETLPITSGSIDEEPATAVNTKYIT